MVTALTIHLLFTDFFFYTHLFNLVDVQVGPFWSVTDQSSWSKRCECTFMCHVSEHRVQLSRNAGQYILFSFNCLILLVSEKGESAVVCLRYCTNYFLKGFSRACACWACLNPFINLYHSAFSASSFVILLLYA